MSSTLLLFLFLIISEAILNCLVIVSMGCSFIGFHWWSLKLHFGFRRIRGQRAPSYLKHPQSIVKSKLPLELQEQPAVTEEEVVSSSGHQVGVEFGIRVLQEQL